MPKTYSTYEAKARLSELLDRVRKGDVVTITHRGRPIAEVRPIERSQEDLARHLDDLRRSGIVSRREENRELKPLATRKGALQRFLESRE
jgi:prevent-host-death family protein